MRDDDNGGARLSRSSMISSSRPPRRQRIEADEGSSMNQDVRIERHGSRQAGALLHVRAELGR